MDLDGILMQEFRMQLMMASDPDIPLSKLRARLYTVVHEADTFARAAQLLAERRGAQRSLRCQLCHVYGHDASTSNARDAPGGSYSQRRRPLRKGKGAARRLCRRTTAAPPIPPPPAIPHRRRTAPPTLHPLLQIARRNRREGKWSLSINDARLWYDEAPASPLWASYMRRANELAREMWAPSKREPRMSLAGQFSMFFAARTNSR
ncbi:hypothetical protein TcCL_ESM11564 [Trypanosoma cruzi]|nr:hypothetical protein TcCL_ESM11564 [Trypanosoma cruzi]